jgi:phage terminase small subunit
LKVLEKELVAMGGRNGQPVNLILANGRSHHLTKAVIEQRKSAEIKTGTKALRCPDYVKKDLNAYKRWKEIIKIYKDVDFVSSGDVGFLARYCVTYSEYIELLERKRRINHISENSDDVEDYIWDSDDFNGRVKKQLSDMISTDAILRLDTAINKKMDLLIKMEDRSFLNPLAKIKNIPKRELEKVNPLAARGFGDV